MVVLIALLQSTEDRNRTQLIRLVHHNSLETTLQSLILLKILLVFIERGSTDSPQFATCQSRFQDIGRIHGALSASGTHQRVNLVDKEDNPAVALGNLVDNALQALLKLALVFCTGNQRTHIQRVQLLVFQVLRHVAAHDTLSQALHDSRLTGTRFANQYRVVLRTSRQNLKHAANLLITSDNRVELALASLLHQVLGILVKTLVVLVAALALHLLSLSQFLDSPEHFVLRASGILQDAACGRIFCEQSEKHRLHADELVAHFLRQAHRLVQHVVRIVREIWLSALHPRQMFNLLIGEHLYLTCVDTELLEYEVRHVLSLHHDALEQVHRFDSLLSAHLCGVDCLLHNLLRFDCKLVECHIIVSFLILFLSFCYAICCAKHIP